MLSYFLCVSLRISVPSAVNRLSAYITAEGTEIRRDTQRRNFKIRHDLKQSSVKQ